MSREPDTNFFDNESKTGAARQSGASEDGTSATGVFGTPLLNNQVAPRANPGEESLNAAALSPPLAREMPAVRQVVFKPGPSGATSPADTEPRQGFTQIFNALSRDAEGSGPRRPTAIAATDLPAASLKEPSVTTVSSASGGEFTRLLRAITRPAPESEGETTNRIPPLDPGLQRHPAATPNPSGGQFTQMFGSLGHGQTSVPESRISPNSGEGFTDLFASSGVDGSPARRDEPRFDEGAPIPSHAAEKGRPESLRPEISPTRVQPSPFPQPDMRHFASSHAENRPQDAGSLTKMLRTFEGEESAPIMGRPTEPPHGGYSPAGIPERQGYWQSEGHAGGRASFTPPASPAQTQPWKAGLGEAGGLAAGATGIVSQAEWANISGEPRRDIKESDYTTIREQSKLREYALKASDIAPVNSAVETPRSSFPAGGRPYMSGPIIPAAPYPSLGGAMPSPPSYGVPHLPTVSSALQPPAPTMLAPATPSQNKMQQYVPLLLLLNLFLEIVVLVVVLFALKH